MEGHLHVILQSLRPFRFILIDILSEDFRRLADLNSLVRCLGELLDDLCLRFTDVVHRSRRKAAHHAGRLHFALLVLRVLLIALDHREEVVLLLHIGVLAPVPCVFLGEVHRTRVQPHLEVHSALDDHHFHLLGAVGRLHLGIGHFNVRLLPRSQ